MVLTSFNPKNPNGSLLINALKGFKPINPLIQEISNLKNMFLLNRKRAPGTPQEDIFIANDKMNRVRVFSVDEKAERIIELRLESLAFKEAEETIKVLGFGEGFVLQVTKKSIYMVNKKYLNACLLTYTAHFIILNAFLVSFLRFFGFFARFGVRILVVLWSRFGSLCLLLSQSGSSCYQFAPKAKFSS